jgi:hypothetical protein
LGKVPASSSDIGKVRAAGQAFLQNLHLQDLHLQDLHLQDLHLADL